MTKAVVESEVRVALADLLKISGQVRVPFIVGGIGPASQVPFQEYLLAARPDARSDQEHIGYNLAVATPFPDRTKALEQKAGGDASLYNNVTRRIRNLADKAHDDGFGFILFLCNTIHAWRDKLQSNLPLLWVSIMSSVAQDLRQKYEEGTYVGVLATNGTLRSGLYEKALRDVGLNLVFPPLDSNVQDSIMDAIYNENPGYGIKATGDNVSWRATKLLVDAAEWLRKEKGAKVLVGGCTEIPLGLNEKKYSELPVVDPLASLAKVTVDLAMNQDVQFPK